MDPLGGIARPASSVAVARSRTAPGLGSQQAGRAAGIGSTTDAADHSRGDLVSALSDETPGLDRLDDQRPHGRGVGVRLGKKRFELAGSSMRPRGKGGELVQVLWSYLVDDQP